ncbi:sensor histidine kinase [Paenibacillus beijingensis]|uniref:histidine kinase n=1 Tax=Paenibacillus beijingensis TaxID=1126833 RepID=A0A0D5NIN9_9BACL|nr:sensor histidine kinase [Paenibacillus beijingensis]AJY74852.1 hypothetical protein VN24_09935 [Paenibacillus beijingensis]
MGAKRITTLGKQRGQGHPNGWLFVFRLTGMFMFGLIAVLFVSKIPSYYVYLKETCLMTACEYAAITPLPRQVVEKAGLTETGFALLYTGITLGFFLIYFAVAALILAKRPREPISIIASLALMSLVTPTFIGMQWRWYEGLVAVIDGLTMVSFILFLLWFPNGKFVRPWVTYPTIGLLAIRLISSCFPNQPWGIEQWPMWCNFLWFALQYGILLYNQYYRFRYAAVAVEKQQTKWVFYGIMLSLTGVFLLSFLPVFFQSDFYEIRDPVWMFLLDLGVMLCTLPIPVTLGISVMRKRLWDIDPIVNRTLVYFLLSTLIIALYTLIVWYLSVLFHSEHYRFYSLFAAGVVAVVFAPLKEKLQRMVNQMLYGKKEDPYTALLQLGIRLKETLNPVESLDIVVQTVIDSLRIPYAGIGLIQNGETVLVAGERKENDQGEFSIELSSGGTALGWLYMGARSPGESFTEADRKLIDAIARQAGIVVRSVKQAMDIQLLLENLRESKEALIFAREEERREMRRNLHDDIAPRLAAMRLTASVASDWIRKDPEKAMEILTKFKADISETVDEIRGIVYDLRPHALDELGLVGAVRQRVEQLRDMQAVNGITDVDLLDIRLDAPDQLPNLPAAVEVGAYRIASEALVNVVKHADASSCVIRIALDECDLVIETTDNGIGLSGFYANRAGKQGIGLTSIRERALELGGSCVIESFENGRGTKITARLPIKPLLDHGEGHVHVKSISS